MSSSSSTQTSPFPSPRPYVRSIPESPLPSSVKGRWSTFAHLAIDEPTSLPYLSFLLADLFLFVANALSLYSNYTTERGDSWWIVGFNIHCVLYYGWGVISRAKKRKEGLAKEQREREQARGWEDFEKGVGDEKQGEKVQEAERCGRRKNSGRCDE